MGSNETSDPLVVFVGSNGTSDPLVVFVGSMGLATHATRRLSIGSSCGSQSRHRALVLSMMCSSQRGTQVEPGIPEVAGMEISMGGGGWGVGFLYLTLHCHHQNDPCVEMASSVSHSMFNVYFTVEQQSHNHTVSTNDNCDRQRRTNAGTRTEVGPASAASRLTVGPPCKHRQPTWLIVFLP